MTGLVLVVDDVPANVKLLEAKLTNEYYDVITAKDGYEAIQQTKARKPDLILLDVMMPGIDGFETCRQLKQDPEVSHIPVVMVTALSEPSDRVQGLEAGADDFITKPINDTALFARVRSLVRIKVLIDELRLRDQSGSQLGMAASDFALNFDVSGSNIMVIDDDVVQSRRMHEKLTGMGYHLASFSDHKQAIDHARKTTNLDLIMISTQLADIDGIRLATQFKALEQVRNVPIIMMVDEEEQHLMLKGLELGVNDYLLTPVDFNEMFARVKTQIRRKKYQEALKSNYQESVSMAVTDGLTRLYNRHYLDTHLKNLVRQAGEQGRNLAVIIMDMDHFKHVNDTYGHNVGDEVLKSLANIIVNTIRSADLAARYGGEEFVVLMPETDAQRAFEAADRLRKNVESTPFVVSHPESPLRKTISIGYATMQPSDTPESLLKRADVALYEAKHGGRNRVCPTSHPPFELSPSRVAAREEIAMLRPEGQGLKLAVAGASGAAAPEEAPSPSFAPPPMPNLASAPAPVPQPAPTPAPAAPVSPSPNFGSFLGNPPAKPEGQTAESDVLSPDFNFTIRFKDSQ
jgi:two-component system cell cycle response regulator